MSPISSVGFNENLELAVKENVTRIEVGTFYMPNRFSPILSSIPRFASRRYDMSNGVAPFIQRRDCEIFTEGIDSSKVRLSFVNER